MSWEQRPYADPNFGGGGGGGSFSDNPLSWAPRLFTMDGIRVRIHILFILYILYSLIESAGAATKWQMPIGDCVSYTLRYLMVVFGSIFLHELGHCYACRKVGGTADEVLMWPLGGLAFVSPPRTPWAEFITVVFGPLVNVAMFLIAAALLGFNVNWNPMNFFHAAPLSWGDGRGWLLLTFQFNVINVMFNLIPMYPMDGGRLFQCAIWSRLGYHRATMIACTVGMVMAILMGLFGVVSQRWMLLTIATIGYIECLRTRQTARFAEAEGQFAGGYDYSGGHTSFEKSARRQEGFVARWKRKRAEARKKAEVEVQINVELEVDRILDKVHRQGMHSLTKAEKRTLEMATKLQKESRGPRI